MNQVLSSWEAIAFQHKSALATQLTALFQDIIDYRNTIGSVDKIKLTATYAAKRMSEKFGSIVLNHTGFKCLSITFSKQFDYGFACLMQLGKTDQYGRSARLILNQYAGIKDSVVQSALPKDVVTADQLIKITKSLDKATGLYRTSKTIKGEQVGFRLYFDPYGAFLIKELGYTQAKALTAEEITAIVVHEIGHMHTMLEHALDNYARVDVANTALDNFKQHAPVEEQLKFLQHTSANSNPTWCKKLTEMIDYLHSISDSKINDSLLSTIYLLLGLWAYPIGRWVSQTLDLIDMVRNAITHYRTNNSTHKYSDLGSSVHNFKYVERLADEFVIRHGLGSALVTSLDKLEYNCNAGILDPLFPYFDKDSSSTWNLHTTVYLVLQAIFMHEDHLESHDTQYTRCFEAMRATLAVFKRKLDPEMLDFYIKDYEDMMAAHQNRESSVKTKHLISILDQIQRYLLALPVTLLVTGRFSPEYEKLIYQAKKLMGNKMYYRSAKLQQLANHK